ncbi:MAG: helix-turn-helix transcriptional regulator [Terriglobia bacterium]
MNDVLRLLRIYHDLKGYELAEQLGVSRSYLSEIEKGKKEPSLDLIRQYAKVFNTTPSAILFLSESFEKRGKKSIAEMLNSKMVGFLKELVNENAEELFD